MPLPPLYAFSKSPNIFPLQALQIKIFPFLFAVSKRVLIFAVLTNFIGVDRGSYGKSVRVFLFLCQDIRIVIPILKYSTRTGR